MIRVNLTNKQLLALMLCLQAVALVSIGLDAIGWGIPGLRPVVLFVLLGFAPGLSILGALKSLWSLKAGEALVYSLGLSIVFVMFVGALVNSIGPLFGVMKPISQIPLLVVINPVILGLSILSYYRNRAIPEASLEVRLSIFHIAAAALLVVMSIIGAVALNSYNSNTILLVYLAVVAVIPLILVWKPSETAYPVFIVAISLSLLLHTSLASNFLSGAGDATTAFYESYQVLLSGRWNANTPTPVASLLSNEIFPPAFSLMLRLDMVWSYTVIYPLMYSLMPLVLYFVLKRQSMPDRVAFLSSCLVMFVFSFFTVFQFNLRNGLAELFISLLMLSIVSKDLPSVARRVLAIVFALAIVVSHYATGYLIFLVVLVSVPALLWYRKYARLETTPILSPNFAVLFFVFTFAWYMYTSSGSFLSTMVSMPRNIIGELAKLFLTTSQLGIGARLPFSMAVTRDLLLAAALFIGIGLAKLVYECITRKTKQDPEYAALTIAIFLAVLATFSPSSVFFSFQRVGHIALVLMAPYCVLGLTEAFRFFARFFKSLKITELTLRAFAVLLLAVLLFGSGFIAETVTRGQDYSPEKLIHKPRWDSIADKWFVYEFYRSYHFPYDVASAEWLSRNMDTSMFVYVDGGEYFVGAGPSAALVAWDKLRPLDQDVIATGTKGYIYIRYLAVTQGQLVPGISSPTALPATSFDVKQAYEAIEATRNRIYSNGGSYVYQ